MSLWSCTLAEKLPSKLSETEASLDPSWAVIELGEWGPLSLGARNLEGGFGRESSFGGDMLRFCISLLPASLDVLSEDCLDVLVIGVKMLRSGWSGSVSLDLVGEVSIGSTSEVVTILLLLSGLAVGVGGREDVLLSGDVP